MAKALHSVAFLIISNIGLSQISGVVRDAETKMPVPYVNIWIEDGTIGTTCDENGAFYVGKARGSDKLILSAVGYETAKTAVTGLSETIYLNPKPLQLDEIKVGTNKKCELKLGKIKGKEVSFVQHSKDGKHGTPYILARYFENTCNKPLYLKKVKIKTSASKNATCNLRFYSADENGAPSNFLHNQNMIANVSQLKLSTTVNLEKLKIQVPENGIFVAVEWLIIDENKRSPQTKFNGSTTLTFWDPGITAIENPGNTNSWVNSGGHWQRQQQHTIAMEVEMMN